MDEIDRLLSPHHNVKKEQRKKRKCLRCRKDFNSSGAGHRMCAKCSVWVQGLSKMQTEM